MDSGAPPPYAYVPPGTRVVYPIVTGDEEAWVTITLDEGVTYWIDGAGGWLGPAIFIYENPDDQFSTYVCGYAEVPCVIDLPAGTYTARINPSADASTEFSFAYAPVSTQGTSATPHAIVSDPLAVLTVEGGESSYYVFDATVSGAYDLQLEAYGYTPHSADPDVHVFTAAEGFGGTPFHSCSAPHYSDPCRFSGFPAGPMLIRVDSNQGLPAGFAIAPVKTFADGAHDDPFALDATPQTSGLDQWSTSFYSFTTTDSGSYVLTVENGPPGLDEVDFEAYLGAVDSPAIDTCWGLTCALWGLEPGTTYGLRATLWAGSPSTDFDVRVDRGVAVGSAAAPYVLTPSVEYAAGLEEGTHSFVEMTAPASAYYFAQINVEGGTYPTVTLEWSLDGGVTAESCVLNWVNTRCDLGPLVSGTTVTYEVSADEATSFGLTIGPEPYGEGIPVEPIVITENTEHLGTIGDNQPNHYRFTTDGTGGDYEVILMGDTTLYASAPFTCLNQIDTRICNLASAGPNETIDFSVAANPDSASHQVSVLLTKISVAAGCEPGALICYDFESGGTPAGFSTPMNSFRTTGASAINGSVGFENGSGSPNCFTFTVPDNARAISYSAEHYSTGVGDHFDIDVLTGEGGSGVARSETPGVRVRQTFGLEPGSVHTLEFCHYTWTSDQHVYLDDIAVR